MVFYRLYAGTKCIDADNNEKHIIESMGECIRKHMLVNYIVIASTKEEDIIYKVIKNDKDYNNYVNEYNEKHKNEKNKKIYVK